MTAKVIGNGNDDAHDDDARSNDADGYANDDNDERFYAEDDMLTKMTDTVQMIASTPRRLNFLCLVSFDRIPTLYHCNTKVSSGSQMVTAKEGEEFFSGDFSNTLPLSLRMLRMLRMMMMMVNVLRMSMTLLLWMQMMERWERIREGFQ